MSSQNPLMPQGALEEQRPRNKSNVYIAVFAILAFHVVLLGALLLQGCKDNRAGASVANNNNEAGLVAPNNTPPADLGMANPFAQPPDLASNPIASGTVNPPPVANTSANPGATLPPVPGPAVVTPPAAGPVTAAAPAGVREHEVQPGENFTSIGKKYNVSPTAIAKANPNVDSRRLRVGQKLKIPEAAATVAAAPETRAPAASALPAPAGGVTYQVKPGDTLTKIARAQGSSVEKIKAANNLKTTMIRAGQKLVIPGRQETAPAAPAVPPTGTGYVTPLPTGTTASL